MKSEFSIELVLLAKELLLIKNKNTTVNWNSTLEKLYAINIGMEETMQFLFGTNCNENDILNWLRNTAQNQKEITNDIEDVLDENDLKFFETNGYLILKNAAPEKECLEAQNAIYNFLNTSDSDKEGWYKQHPGKRGLMLTFSRHKALDKVRNSIRLKKAYEQLYGTKKIYKTIDKVSFNPPETNSYKFEGEHQHLDVSLGEEIKFTLQGLIYLSHCSANDGPFMCVPGFHTKINNWINDQKPDINIRAIIPKISGAIKVCGNMGDAVIWHQGLPHCASPNKGNLPRMVQYVTYRPIGYQQAEKWL